MSVEICPYNKLHKIAKSRFQKHLIKCERNYPPGYLSICPFSACHRMTKSELQNHIKECPIRTTLLRVDFDSNNVKQNHNVPERKLYMDDIEDGEDWEVKRNDLEKYEISKYGAKAFDDRVPNWVDQTLQYKNSNVENVSSSTSTDEVEACDSISQISSNLGYGVLGHMLKKTDFKKFL